MMDNKGWGKRELIAIIALLIVYLGLRLIAATRIPLWEDELPILFGQRLSIGVFSHALTGEFIRDALFSLFGASSIVARSLAILCALASFFVFLRFLNENYDKKMTLLSLAILAFSTWHVFFSTTICVNNEFSTLLLLAALLYFTRYLRGEKRKDLLAAGLLLGLLTAVYETMAVYAVPFGLFLLIARNSKGIKELLLEMVLLAAGFFGVVLLYIAANFLIFGWDSLYVLVKWGLLDKTRFYSFDLTYLYYHVYSFLRMFLYAGPLLVLGALYSLLRRGGWKAKRGSTDLLLLLLLIVGLLFFVVIIPPANHQVRYLGPIVPLLCIMASRLFIGLRLGRKELFTGAIAALLVFGLLFFINAGGQMINVKDYAKNGIVSNLKTYFISVHPNDSGTTITNGILLFSFLASLVIFACLKARLMPKSLVATLLIGLCCGFGLFTLQEYLLHLSGVNFDQGYLRISEFLNREKPGEVIYTNLDAHIFTEAYALRNNLSLREMGALARERLDEGKNLEIFGIEPSVKERVARIRFVSNYELANLSSAGLGEFFARLKEEKAFIILINNHLYYDESSGLIEGIKENCQERETTRTGKVLTSLIYQC
jgi:hypothetical protein